MTLIYPHFAVLDSATLIKAAIDYWGSKQTQRDKARDFLSRLGNQSIYVTLTVTHLIEVLRCTDETIARQRLEFLGKIPLVAGLRPYDGDVGVGCITDLLRHELHAFIHDSKIDWQSIVEHVRKGVWTIGFDSEIKNGAESLWNAFRTEAKKQEKLGQTIASIARIDPGNIYNVTIGQLKALEPKSKDELVASLQNYKYAMQQHLEQHGDKRLKDSNKIAMGFTDDIGKRLRAIQSNNRDLVQGILDYHGVPSHLVTDDMTVNDVGELAVFNQRIKALSRRLKPSTVVSLDTISPDALPSYALQRLLVRIQRRADRVAGSDLGDGHVAPLVLYADSVEVDKRTLEFLNQLLRGSSTLRPLIQKYYRSSDYATIPDYCRTDTR